MDLEFETNLLNRVYNYQYIVISKLHKIYSTFFYFLSRGTICYKRKGLK